MIGIVLDSVTSAGENNSSPDVYIKMSAAEARMRHITGACACGELQFYFQKGIASGPRDNKKAVDAQKGIT